MVKLGSNVAGHCWYALSDVHNAHPKQLRLSIPGLAGLTDDPEATSWYITLA